MQRIYTICSRPPADKLSGDTLKQEATDHSESFGTTTKKTDRLRSLSCACSKDSEQVVTGSSFTFELRHRRSLRQLKIHVSFMSPQNWRRDVVVLEERPHS